MASSSGAQPAPKKKKKSLAEIVEADMKGWKILEPEQPQFQDANQLHGMKSTRTPDAVSPELESLRKKFGRGDSADSDAAAGSADQSSTDEAARIVRVVPKKAGSVDDRSQARSKSSVIKGDEIIGKQG
jgi:hypothetical protein